MKGEDFPDGFKDREDYLRHVAQDFDQFHDDIIKDESKFNIVRNIGLAISIALGILIVMRITTPDNDAAIVVIGVIVTLLFIFLLVNWFIIRNYIIHLHHLRIRDYQHKLEDLEFEHSKYKKKEGAGHWWETEEAFVHKSEGILRKANEEDSHYRRYVTNLGYLVVFALLLLILKFIFKVA